MVRRTIVSACVLIAALALSAPSAGQDVPEQVEGLTVSPARVSGIATPGASYGPINFSNSTGLSFRVVAMPVFVSQERSGAIQIRDDAASNEEAARLVDSNPVRFRLDPGQSETATAILRRRSVQDNFYGGILFRGVPIRKAGEEVQFEAIYRVNGRLFLRPPPKLQDISLEAEPIRAEQAGQFVRALAGIRNTGNTDVTPTGTVRVRDAAGNEVYARNVKKIQILPGATVDLPATLKTQLPAGEYELDAALEFEGRRLRASGSIELFDANEVADEDAKLTQFLTETPYLGEDLEVVGKFENTGNVPYAPHAELSIESSPAEGGGLVAPEISETVELRNEVVAPGEEGAIAGSIRMPDVRANYELTMTIKDDDGIVLDSRTSTVQPVDKPGPLKRATDWVTDNAVSLVILLLLALTVAVVVLVRMLRTGERG